MYYKMTLRCVRVTIIATENYKVFRIPSVCVLP